MCNPGCATCGELRAAALEIVGADGIDALTIERLAEVAGVSTGDVRGHYPDASSCLYATYAEVSASIYEDFARAFALEVGWRRALTLAAQTLLARLAARPAEARLCFVEVLRSDHELLRRRDAARRRLVDLFVAELGRRRHNAEQARMQLELIIGAGFQAIASAIADHEAATLPGLKAELETRALVFEPAVA